MLFNSSIYIFLFLPCVAVVYFFLNRMRFVPAATVWLVLASLFFYRYWHASYLFILITSILVNFGFGAMLHQTGRRHKRITRGAILTAGVLFNLCLLGYFKYADFFLTNVNHLFGSVIPLPQLTLPLAISFFTFQQIAYLVDCSQENANEYDFLNYCLFVSFFPQLIAGPIVHHQEMMPQFARLRNKVFSWSNTALGIFFFSVGLFKKVWIADQFSIWVKKGFDTDINLTFFDAWGASLCYTFQLYFDFSGYSDMAIGSALFFNIVLPINFNSPYKASNIREFWRRWHMTLSRWLRDYLYIPLGGNRKGWTRTLIHLFVTFVLAGLWHGAGWTFILWGGMHGAALISHRLWQRINLKIPYLFSWLLTFLFINFSWVVFRATSLADGLRVLKGMAGLNGFVLSPGLAKHFDGLDTVSKYMKGIDHGSLVLPAQMYWYLLFFGLVLVLMPNSCQMGGLIKSWCSKTKERREIGRFRVSVYKITHYLSCFQPNYYWALLSGVLFSMAIYQLLRAVPTEFLYFNF